MREALLRIADRLRHLTDTVYPQIDPNPSSRTYVDPVLWAKTVATFGVAVLDGAPSPSGTATSTGCSTTISRRSGPSRSASATRTRISAGWTRNYGHWRRNYLRAPYDPPYEAQAARFFSRGLLYTASAGGRMRIGILIVAMAALVGTVISLGVAINAVIAREGQ